MWWFHRFNAHLWLGLDLSLSKLSIAQSTRKFCERHSTASFCRHFLPLIRWDEKWREHTLETQSTYLYKRWNRVSVSAHTATLLVMVNVKKGVCVHPPPSTAQANFTLMTECTPESRRYYSVYSVAGNHPSFLVNFIHSARSSVSVGNEKIKHSRNWNCFYTISLSSIALCKIFTPRGLISAHTLDRYSSENEDLHIESRRQF